MAKIIAIDPGTSGGIAVFPHQLLAERDPVTVHKMPETPHDLANLLVEKTAGWELLGLWAYVERVGPARGRDGRVQGVSSTWKFGYSTGVIHGCLAALRIPFVLVAPITWQRALCCLTRGDKNVSKAMAQRLFPHLKVTHAVADALLIGEYARRTIHKEAS